MSDRTAISWTDATWSPITGCDHVSPGCDNCYAERVAARFHRPFLGAVELHPERLDVPLHWRRPRRVFVCSVSDLFHQDVPDDFIASVFATMSLTPRHTFQVLTKRTQRMARLLADHEFLALVDDIRGAPAGDFTWPLPNVWCGTSVETQRYADLRIPHLLATPAAVRFLSVEPMLGPVSLTAWLNGGFGRISDADVDWCIVGGESGPDARPMQVEWARDLLEECAAAGVAFFMKQSGRELAREWGARGAGTEPQYWPADLRVQEYPT